MKIIFHICLLYYIRCLTLFANTFNSELIFYFSFLQADENFLRGPHIEVNGEGLETSTLGLEFKVRHKHFRRGDLKLKCLATIATIFWKSNEESVEGDRPQKAPVLESREETMPPREYIGNQKLSFS